MASVGRRGLRVLWEQVSSRWRFWKVFPSMTPELGSEDKRTNWGRHSREIVHPSIPLMGALYIISIHPLNNFSLDKKTETDIKVGRARNRWKRVLTPAVSAFTITLPHLTFCWSTSYREIARSLHVRSAQLWPTFRNPWVHSHILACLHLLGLGLWSLMTGSEKLKEIGPRESFSAAFNSLTDQDTPYPLSTQGFSEQPQSAMEDTLMGLSWGRDSNANRWQMGSLSEVEGLKSDGEWRPWGAVSRLKCCHPAQVVVVRMCGPSVAIPFKFFRRGKFWVLCNISRFLKFGNQVKMFLKYYACLTGQIFQTISYLQRLV